MSQSYVNKGMYVNNVLNSNTLNVAQVSNFSGNALAKNMFIVNGNTDVTNGLTLQNTSMFFQGFSSNSSLNLNNNQIINLGDPAPGSDSDLVNLRTFNKYQPKYYSYQSRSGAFVWDLGTFYDWLYIEPNFTSFSPNYEDFFNISGANINLNGIGLYNFSVYIYKIGGLGNGYGGHIRVAYTDPAKKRHVLGYMYMWNEQGQNFPGALVDVSFPVKESGGFISMGLIDNSEFTVQFVSFQLMYYPLIQI